MSNQSLYQLVERYPTKKNVYDLEIMGGDIIMLAVTGVVYFVLVFLIEAQKRNIFERVPKVPHQPHQIDADVEKENKIIE